MVWGGVFPCLGAPPHYHPAEVDLAGLPRFSGHVKYYSDYDPLDFGPANCHTGDTTREGYAHEG